MGAPKKRARESSAFDAESMGAPGRSTNAQSDPLAALGDAGMVLRDPATMRLIIHYVSLLPDRTISLHKACRLAEGASLGVLQLACYWQTKHVGGALDHWSNLSRSYHSGICRVRQLL